MCLGVFTDHKIALALSIFSLDRCLAHVSETYFFAGLENIEEVTPLWFLYLVLGVGLNNVESFICEIQH